MPPGHALILYTDGLVERRGVPLDENLFRLLDAVRGIDVADDICAAAFAELVPPEGLRDDVAMIVMQHSLVPEQLRLTLPTDPRVLVYTRRALRRWLKSRHVPDEIVTPIVLAVSEACTNAIQHGRSARTGAFELDASPDGEAVTVIVRDRGRWRQPRDNHGHGLAIIREAMDHVEVHTADSGTEVLMRRSLRL